MRVNALMSKGRKERGGRGKNAVEIEGVNC